LVACGGGQNSAKIATSPDGRQVISDIGLATPECVIHDTKRDVYLVSNINGNPLEADGNGFITVLSPDGSVEELKWIDGATEGVSLDAPKGMAISGGNLFIADITFVRVFDAATGSPKESIEIPGSTFLGDVAPASNGAVIVSDIGLKAGEKGFEPSGTDGLYNVKPDGSYERLATGDELGGPNGVLAEGDDVVVVTFGSGEFYRYGIDGERHQVASAPTGALDGIVAIGEKRYAITSWGGKALYVLEPTGEFRKVAADLVSPADLGIDTKRNRVMVPLFTKNQIVYLPL
jgi:hypothetical protein